MPFLLLIQCGCKRDTFYVEMSPPQLRSNYEREGVETHYRMEISWLGNTTPCVLSAIRNTLPTHGVDDTSTSTIQHPQIPFFPGMQLHA